MNRVLLDSSFVIALARGENIALDDPPAEAAISAVTLCGLHHGVLIADDARRAARLAALVWVEREFEVLPVDGRVAAHYGRLVAAARHRHGSRLRMGDALIAATAAAHGLPLVTCDRDFEGIDGVEVVLA